MKRFGWILLAAALLLALGCAWAEGAPAAGVDCWPGESYSEMRVVNCEEWVSMRAEPSTAAEVVEQISLDATVYNCRAASDGFTYCEDSWTDGKRGYIRSEYLAGPAFRVRRAGESLEGTGILDEIADFSFEDYEEVRQLQTLSSDQRIYCAGGWGNIRVSCFDGEGNFKWGAYTDTDGFGGEDTDVSAFTGGTYEHPLAYVHNEKLGLAAINIETGAVEWTIDNARAFLGMGPCWATGDDGTLYIGGDYDTDPVAISLDGDILWESDAGDLPCWIFEILLTDREVLAFYDGPDEDDYIVRFDRDTGDMISCEHTIF